MPRCGTTTVTPVWTAGGPASSRVTWPTRTPATSVIALRGPVGYWPTTMPRSLARISPPGTEYVVESFFLCRKRIASPAGVTQHGRAERNYGPVARPNRQTQRRAEILDAAIALIERHDLATLRVTDVAAELGLTANAVRYYFRDMHQLLSEL